MKVGDTVEWTSQSAGTTKVKRGAVVSVIPIIGVVKPGKHPWRLLPSEFGWAYTLSPGTRRDVSYIVDVPGVGPHWPRASWPRVVEG